MEFTPHGYQTRAIDMIEGTPRCALFLDMGLGKTVSTLTAVRSMQDRLDVGRVLVIAPLSVARNTWTSECAKWDHLMDTRVSVVLGSAAQRRKALEASADIYVINRENVQWLCDEHPCLDEIFDMIVIDESSSFKSHSAKRFKALRKASRDVPRMVLLTGTPSPNGYEDLWAQFALLDGGQRLCATYTAYMRTWFHSVWGSGHVVYKYAMNMGAREAITARISDITLSMKASDYLSLPEMLTIDHVVGFAPEVGKAYRDFTRHMMMDVDATTITAETAVALTGKLQQYTGGAVYDEAHEPHVVNHAKLDALVDLVEAASASGENVLVYYQFRHELPRIKAALKDYTVEAFSGEPDTLRRWNEGKIRVLVAHPASVSYGLNMQGGGHIIVWYSLTYNLEQYQQANARLHRQGQVCPVRCYRLVVPDTIDMVVAGALECKDRQQETLLRAIKEMRDGI